MIPLTVPHCASPPSAVTNLSEIIKIKFPSGETYLGGVEGIEALGLRGLDQVDVVEGW